MSLPQPWVDRIFDKLTLVYGHHFIGRWAGMKLDAVKADWGHTLDGLERHPEAIRHALQNLPSEKPPTVLQFRDLCRLAPEAPAPALPNVKADPARVAEALARMRASPEGKGGRDWAWRLRERELQGAKLSPAQREMWRSALRVEMATAEAEA